MNLVVRSTGVPIADLEADDQIALPVPGNRPVEVVTDAAAVYPAVLADLVPAAWHHVEQYANNPVETDHCRLKQRLRPMRRLRADRTAQAVIAGHAFVQNLRRGHYEIATETPAQRRLAAAFTDLATAT